MRGGRLFVASSCFVASLGLGAAWHGAAAAADRPAASDRAAQAVDRAAPAQARPEPVRLEAGRALYERGLRVDGEPVRAHRAGGVEAAGATAACALCHRRSGVGTTEGTSPVPTIDARSLFEPPPAAGTGARIAPGITLARLPQHARPPYTDETLARALTEGVAPDGRVLGFLMPRYELAGDDLRALVAYLRTLGAAVSPGADNRLAHFATVIAPDTQPARRRQMLQVLNACFQEQYPEHFTDPRGRIQEGERLAWRLHTWTLEGDASTWPAQLAAHYRRQPVFALVSGLAGENWAPVHEFCEAGRLPCLFPNTELPGAPDDATYSFYFYRGVLLEADALAQHLRGVAGPAGQAGIGRVVQIAPPRGAGAEAARRLAQALDGAALTVEVHAFERAARGGLRRMLARLGRRDVLVAWLREPDLRALVSLAPVPPGAALVAVSGALGGADRPPLNAAWKRSARVLYPFDPPRRWNERMRYNLRPWLAKNGIARGDERLQGNTLTACNFLVTGVARLQGHWQRDLLLENVEVGLEGNQAAPSAFPRFSLGPNQRFGSKGAFVVKFEPPPAGGIARDSDWLVP